MTKCGVRSPPVEDEVCVTSFGCELEAGHDGMHRATYPGLDGDVAVPMHWKDGASDSERVRFHRGRPVDQDPLSGPPQGACEKCRVRPATSWFTTSASMMDIVHGAPVSAWCELCVLDAQIAEAEKQVERLDALRQKRDLLAGSVTTGQNIDRPVIEIRHANQRRANSESAYRLWCPICRRGLLLVRRHPTTFKLLRLDRCTTCGQAFKYVDATIAGEELVDEDEAP